MAGDSQTPRRVSRACDACKTKRIKCENSTDGDEGQSNCKGCREAGQYCMFEAPVRRRGPAIGFKRRRQPSTSTEHVTQVGSSSTPVLRVPNNSLPMSATPPKLNGAQTSSSSQLPSPDSSHPPSHMNNLKPSGNRDAPLLGLPRPMVDELLAAYFTHVHNVWPLIYKPAFTPYNVSPLLLCSMLAISACVSPPSTASGYDARKLFRMAESALRRSGAENRIDVVQALILLSLTQTGCGDKGAAFIYASRAVGMILNMGLNLARKYDQTSVDEQIRSRVFWNCYVLDKSLSEETGRSYLLPYRRCSTPFPSLDEVDELEVWPPVSTSSAPLPRCVRRLTPRRGHVISCFIWTCRLAMVVEDILDLDQVCFTGDNEWDHQFRESSIAKRGQYDEEREAARIEQQLDRWREMLPVHLTPNNHLSPLPHVIIGLAWHATATIMLHSRFVVRTPSISSLPAMPSERAARSHSICSDAARQTVQMLRSLDKFGLLEQISSDAIHILSLATLFDAFDMTNPDGEVAARAKEDFTQCCAWLRHFSSMWPAASAHKLFFEAVVQGGLKLADPEAGNEDCASPLRHTASLLSPSLTGGLQAVRRHLSVSNPSDSVLPMPAMSSASAGAGGMLQIPHFFWNHLSTATTNGGSIDDPGSAGQNLSWDDMFNFGGSTVDSNVVDGDPWGLPVPGEAYGSRGFENPQAPPPWSVPLATTVSYPSASCPQENGTSGEMRPDQAAISTALMNFIADMSRNNSQ